MDNRIVEDIVSTLLEEDLGCLMLNIHPEEGSYILKWRRDNVNSADIDETEQNPHVTVVYGFDRDVDPEEVFGIVRQFMPLTIELGQVTKFDGDDRDVLKIDVVSDRLVQLNAVLVETFKDRVTVTFPDYHPHVTLAYVRKGTCADVVGSQYFEGDYFVMDEAIYSGPGRVKTRLVTG